MFGMVPRWLVEIGAGSAAVVGAAVISLVAELAGASPIAQYILGEFGPFGLVVYLLWRRLDRMEENISKLQAKHERERERD